MFYIYNTVHVQCKVLVLCIRSRQYIHGIKSWHTTCVYVCICTYTSVHICLYIYIHLLHILTYLFIYICIHAYAVYMYDTPCTSHPMHVSVQTAQVVHSTCCTCSWYLDTHMYYHGQHVCHSSIWCIISVLQIFTHPLRAHSVIQNLPDSVQTHKLWIS